MRSFADRHDAGRRLAGELVELGLRDPVVLALPRGGVPVGYEVARALHAPLDVLVVRKVGAPGNPEYGIGAIAEGGARVSQPNVLRLLDISEERFDQLAAREMKELERRREAYRGHRALIDVRGRDAIIVDDGLATGVTAHAAVLAVRSMGPRRLIVAAPTCAVDTAQRLEEIADDVVCVVRPEHFIAVGQWYDDFQQTSDETVVALLERARPQTRSA